MREPLFIFGCLREFKVIILFIFVKKNQMEFKNLLTETKDTVFIITINRPDKLNALNIETIEELNKAFTKAEQDKAIKAIILTGSGAKAFVAGADISEFSGFTVQQGKSLSFDGHKRLFDFVENLSKPVIAAVNGFALGGGLELAMSCHIRVASETARMGLPEVSLGVIPGYGGTQRLPQLVGKGRAFEMILTGDMINAQEAYRIGLVNHLATADDLLKKCEEIAFKIATRSTIAVKSAIRAVNAGFKNDVNGFDLEIEEFGKCFGTDDFKEGTAAFEAKRKPVFPGS